LAYARAGRIHLLGQERSLEGWPGVHWVAVSPNGRWIAASSWANNGVRLWEAGSGALVREFPTGGHAADVAFSPDNRWLVLGAPGEYCFWDLNAREIVRRLPRGDTPNFHGMIAFSPDGQLMALARSLTQVQLLKPETLEEVARLES